MKISLKIIVVLLMYQNIAWAEQNYSSLTPIFKDGECIIFSWVPDGEKRIKLEYTQKAMQKSDGSYTCEVHIPIKEFEKHFQVCFLVGISYTREGSHKPYGVAFYGGAANGRDDIYWFQWSDAEFTHSDYRCLLK